jgi:digeranylgeranylglycerophospholipid reductase
MSASTEFDALVVGAGPAGSTVAEALALASLRVALLEEHAAAGVPNHCSGLVSPRTLEIAGIPEETVALRHYDRARVWGPGGGTLWLQSSSVQAIAVAREQFDQILARRAAGAGAVLMLETKAQHFERADGRVRLLARTPRGEVQFQAPLLVGADGAGSRVARWMGRAARHEVIPAVKADITFSGRGTDSVEIFVGSRVAPGWFGWLIPLPGRVARIGVGATRSPQDCFAALLDLVRARFGDFDLGEVRKAPLPLGPARDFVADGVLLVGAAARQTKPTTGGGVYLGVRAGQLAAATAIEALASGDTSRRALLPYEQAWHRLEGHEIRVAHWLRQVFRRLPDRELDWILATAGEPWAQRLIAGLGDIDFPSQLLSALLRGAVRRVGPPRTREVLAPAREAVP